MSKKPQYDPEEIRYPDQKIVESPLVPEMENSYIEYAMSVIVGRALPDVRDGYFYRRTRRPQFSTSQEAIIIAFPLSLPSPGEVARRSRDGEVFLPSAALFQRALTERSSPLQRSSKEHRRRSFPLIFRVWWKTELRLRDAGPDFSSGPFPARGRSPSGPADCTGRCATPSAAAL